MNPSYSPYQIPTVPPSGYWLGPIDELLAPARRASTLMLVLGGLALLTGLCFASAMMIPAEQFIRQGAIAPAELAKTGLTAEQYIKLGLTVTSVVFSGSALVMLGLGFWVRRGGVAAAIVSIVMVSLLLLLVALFGVVNLLAGMDPRMVASVGIACSLIGMLVLLIIWLAGAVKAAGAIQSLKQQQLAQWYAMQHHPAWTGYGPAAATADRSGVIVTQTQPIEPRIVLNRAATWIGRFGVGLVVVGAVLAICGKTVATSLPTVKMIFAIILWIVPGVAYLLTARGLLRRKRWAITSANVITYAQLVVAGLLVLVALLMVKTLWPMILVSAVWIVVLLQTPPRLIGLTEAMDQLAARVTDR